MASFIWKALLQRYLAETARAQVQATHEATLGDPRTDVGIVFAMGIEAGGFEDLLENPTVIRGDRLKTVSGSIAGRRVTFVITGMGPAAARRGTEALVTGHQPQWVISAGFSGGLREELKFGDIVLGTRIVDGDGRVVDLDLRIDPQSARQPRLHVGGLFMSDCIVCKTDHKRALGERHDALAVDMESHVVAEACKRYNVPVLAIRIVSDDAEHELPQFLDRLAQTDSTSRKAGVVVGALVKKPGHFKTLLKMREDSLTLSDRLARFLAGTIAGLPIT